jgi:hypothetical protein
VDIDADRLLAQILRADDDFLMEVGRLTLLFAEIEYGLARSVLQLADLASKHEFLEPAEKEKVMRARIPEKRKLVKMMVAELGRFYAVDGTKVLRKLDELENVSKLRNAIVHGSLHWSAADQQAVFLDSHGKTASAWPSDLLSTSQKAIEWFADYSFELAAFGRAILKAIDGFTERLLNHPRLPSESRQLLLSLKLQVSGQLAGFDIENE